MNKDIYINQNKYKVILHKGKYFIPDHFGYLIEVKYDGIYAYCPKRNVFFRCTGNANLIHYIPKYVQISYI